MFQVNSVNTTRGHVRFGQAINFGGGKLSIITGPNGSGKTEILATLAYHFRGRREGSSKSSVDWVRYDTPGFPVTMQDQEGPSRLIAQTFSPFSRFPPPLRNPRSLTDTYSEGRKDAVRYRTVGIHLGYRYPIGLLARRAVEQGLVSKVDPSVKTFSRRV